MSFLGLPFTTLVGLFGGLAALTTLLYVLKLRRRAVAVPFARVWDAVLRDKESSQLFSQLKRWLSLALQLLLVLAMVLALGDPRLGAVGESGRSVVVLIDASASMKATDESPSRVDRAKEEARRFVRGLGAADRAMIVQMDVLPTPRSTLTAEIPELEQAIERVQAVDTRADLGRALGFAEDSLRGMSRPEIVLVTDGALELPTRRGAGSIPLSTISVGKSDTNVAITEFSARRYPLDKSRVEVMIELTNTNDRPADVELSLFGDGVVIDVTRLRLAPNERLPRFYSDIAGARRKLEAEIALLPGGKDAQGSLVADQLPTDNRARALMPERKRTRVLVVTPGNTYLEAALLLDEYLDVTFIEPAQYPPKESFDVSIFDEVAPVLAANTRAALYLNPPAEGSPVALGEPIKDFGFDSWDRKHPILRFTALGDVQAAHGFRLRPGASDQILGASELGPILVQSNRNGVRQVVLAFDPRDSDFVLRPAWPLFVLGTIDYFVEEDSGYLASYRTGENWRIPAPSSADSAELVLPGGESVTVPVRAGRAIYFGEHAGFYKLRTKGKDPFEYVFAANLADAEESRIRPNRELRLGEHAPRAAVMGTPGVRHRLWAWLLLGVALISVIEWCTYHRRVTV